MLVGDVAPASMTRSPGSVWRRFRSAAHPPEYRRVLRTVRAVNREIRFGFLLEQTLDHSKTPCQGNGSCLDSPANWTLDESGQYCATQQAGARAKSEHSPGSYDRNGLASWNRSRSHRLRLVPKSLQRPSPPASGRLCRGKLHSPRRPASMRGHLLQPHCPPLVRRDRWRRYCPGACPRISTSLAVGRLPRLHWAQWSGAPRED